MTTDTITILIYAALLLPMIAVVTLSVVVLKLTWRDKRATGAMQQADATQKAVPTYSDNPALSGDRKSEASRTLASSHEFTGKDYPPPRDKIHYRLRYEPIGKLAKEKRLQAGRDRQNVRLALSSLASKGTYVFEDLMTDEGAIDFLAISRTGVNLVLDVCCEDVMLTAL